jgi:8-oxo-dGTP pyrophosphatase MutT (NUDIX family)/signal transduction histidine kinase
MALVAIEGVGNVRFPEDMSSDEINSVIEKEILPAHGIEPHRYGFFESLGSAFKQPFQGFIPNLKAAGAAAGIGTLSQEDINGPPADIPTAGPFALLEKPRQVVGETLGQGLGSAITSTPLILGGMAAGTAAGTALAGPPGGVVGGLAGGFAGAYPLNLGDTYLQFRQENIPDDQAKLWAKVVAVPISMLDTFTLGQMSKALSTYGTKPLVRAIGRALGGGTAKEVEAAGASTLASKLSAIVAEHPAISGTMAETFTEAAQQVMQEAAAANLTDTDFFTSKRMENILQAGLAGGVGGAGIGGLARMAGLEGPAKPPLARDLLQPGDMPSQEGLYALLEAQKRREEARTAQNVGATGVDPEQLRLEHKGEAAPTLEAAPAAPVIPQAETFSTEELGAPLVQRIAEKTGQPVPERMTISEVTAALSENGTTSGADRANHIDRLLAIRHGFKLKAKVSEDQITKAAHDDANIVTNGGKNEGFRSLMKQITGWEDITTMSHPQRFAVLKILQEMQKFPVLTDLTKLAAPEAATGMPAEAHGRPVGAAVGANAPELIPGHQIVPTTTATAQGTTQGHSLYGSTNGVRQAQPIATFPTEEAARAAGVERSSDEALSAMRQAGEDTRTPEEQSLGRIPGPSIAQQRVAQMAADEATRRQGGAAPAGGVASVIVPQGGSPAEVAARIRTPVKVQPNVVPKAALAAQQIYNMRGMLQGVMTQAGLDAKQVALSLETLIPAGVGRRAEGEWRDFANMIAVALDSPMREPMRALHHEIVHALREHGLISDKNWELLKAKIDREGWLDRPIGKHKDSIRTRYAGQNLTQESLHEEAVADMFAAHAMGDLHVSGFFPGIYHKIRNFFEALRNGLTGQGFHSADDIFERMGQGEAGIGTTGEMRRQTGEAAPQTRQSLADEYGNRTGALETVPAKEIAVGPAILSLPTPAREAFTRSGINLIQPRAGTDIIATGLRIPAPSITLSTGAFEGNVNPNALVRFPGNTPQIKVNQYVRAWQYVFRQAAVPWIRPDIAFNQNDPRYAAGRSFEFKQDLTLQQEQIVYALLQQAHPEMSYTKVAPNEIAVLNFRADGVPFMMTDADFHIQMRILAKALHHDIAQTSTFGAETRYFVHNWGTTGANPDPGGSALERESRAAGGPDLLARLHDARRNAAKLEIDAASQAQVAPGTKLSLSDRTGGKDVTPHSSVQAWSRGPLFPAILTRHEYRDAQGNVIGTKHHLLYKGQESMHDSYDDAAQAARDLIAQDKSSKFSLADEPGSVRATPGVDMARMAKLLGPQLYGNMKDIGPVTIKEMFQNSFDALKGALAQGHKGEANIDIDLDDTHRTITLTDNGTGMTPETINKAFLTLAGTQKETERASGGLGIAKMLFLFGNESLQLRTVRNGLESTLNTSGAQLMSAFTDPSKAPDILMRKTSAPSGTVVTVKVPETYHDDEDGTDKPIQFPDSYDAHRFLKESPLFEPVNVRVNGDTVPIGKNFPADEYTVMTVAKFPWGKVRVLVAETQYPGYNNVSVLSNGLFQFDEKISKDPLDIFSGSVPYKFFFNIEPDVKADAPNYPISLNRKGYSQAAKSDFETLTKYINVLYANKQDEASTSSFGTLAQWSPDGTRMTRVNLNVPPAKQSTTLKIDKNDKVEVRDGRLYVNNRIMPEMTKENLKAMQRDPTQFRVDQNLLDPQMLIVHDNVLLDGKPYLEEAAKEVGTAQLYGYLRGMGNVFKRVRDAVVREGGPQYADASQVPVGVSVDTEYYGVNTSIPFKAMMLNPTIVRDGFGTDPASIHQASVRVLSTMIHELVHHTEHNHSETGFIPELQRMGVVLAVSGDSQKIVVTLRELLRDYKAVTDYFTRTRNGNLTNRGIRLAGGPESTGSAGVSGRLAEASEAGGNESDLPGVRRLVGEGREDRPAGGEPGRPSAADAGVGPSPSSGRFSLSDKELSPAAKKVLKRMQGGDLPTLMFGNSAKSIFDDGTEIPHKVMHELNKAELIEYPRGGSINSRWIVSVPPESPPESTFSTHPGSSYSMADEEAHARALAETGFWGNAGAGVIFRARDTGRVMLAHRSKDVEQPGTWGTWGGAIDRNETPQDAVRREVMEEAGYSGVFDLTPLYTFKKGAFSYHNFIAEVDHEFTPSMDWETQGYAWTKPDELPKNLHFGVQSILKDERAASILRGPVSQAPSIASVITPEQQVQMDADRRKYSISDVYVRGLTLNPKFANFYDSRSNLRDRNNLPLVLYHGTGYPVHTDTEPRHTLFESFEPGMRGFYPMTFLSTSPSFASGYAGYDAQYGLVDPEDTHMGVVIPAFARGRYLLSEERDDMRRLISLVRNAAFKNAEQLHMVELRTLSYVNPKYHELKTPEGAARILRETKDKLYEQRLLSLLTSMSDLPETQDYIDILQSSIRPTQGMIRRVEAYIVNNFGEATHNWPAMEQHPVHSVIRAAGYDGMTITEDAVTNVAVFDGRNIKSVWNEEFDPKNQKFSLTGDGVRMVRDEGLAERLGRRFPVLADAVHDFTTPMGHRDDLRIKFQDRNLSLQRLNDFIKARNGSVPDAFNSYVKADALNNVIGDRIDRAERTLYTPLIDELKRSKVPINEADAWLAARHAPERNAYLKAKFGVINGSGPSYTDAAAPVLQAKIEAQYGAAQMQKIGDLFDNIIRNTNEVRQDNALTEVYDPALGFKHYAPLRKSEEDVDESPIPQWRKTGLMGDVRGREDPQMTGRKKDPEHVIAQAIMQNEKAIERAESANVGRAFAGLVRSAEPIMKGTVEEQKFVPTQKEWVVDEDGAIRVKQHPAYNDPNTLVVKEADQQNPGKIREAQFLIHDHRLAAAIKGVNPANNETAGTIIKVMGRLNTILARVNTAWNPEFFLSNLPKDIAMAEIVLQGTDYKGVAGRIAGNIPSAIKGVYLALKNDPAAATNEWAMAFDDMSRHGGKTAFLGLRDIGKKIEVIQKRVQAMQDGRGVTGKVMDTVRAVGEYLEQVNTVFENATRLAAYKAAIDAGATKEQAGTLARNITVNFSRGGQYKTLMNSLYLFYNASLQGTMVMVGALKSPRVRKIAYGIVGTAFLIDMLNRAMSPDDKDGENAYDKIMRTKAWAGEHNMILMMPGSTKYIAIPMPYGFNAFYNAGRNLSSMVAGKTPVGKAVNSTIMTALDAANPLGGTQNWLNFVSPTLFDPLVDLSTNKNFAGQTIVPEQNPFSPGQKPNSQLYWSNTALPYVKLSEWINKISGGTTAIPGAVDISPETLSYLMDFITGSAGKFAQRTARGAYMAITGDGADVEVSGIPFLRKVVGGLDKRAETESFYTHAAEVLTIRNEMKEAIATHDAERVKEVLTTHQKDLQIAGVFAKADAQLAALRGQKRKILADSAVPEEFKRTISKRLDAQMDYVIQNSNRLYVSAHAQK